MTFLIYTFHHLQWLELLLEYSLLCQGFLDTPGRQDMFLFSSPELVGDGKTEDLLGDGATGPAIRDLGERAQVKVNVSDVAAVREDHLLPQTVAVGIVGLRKVNHLLVGLSQTFLVALPGGPGVTDENHLILRCDVLHQLRQVLPQSFGVALVSLGDFLDESFLRLIDENDGGLEQPPDLQRGSVIEKYQRNIKPWRRGVAAC